MPRRVRGGASSAATSGAANSSLPTLVRSPSPAQSPSAKQMGEGLRDAGHVINQSNNPIIKIKHLTTAGGLWEPISLSFGTLNHFTPEVASARLSDRTLLTRKDRSAGRRRSSERETPPPFPLEARGSLSGARQCPHLTPQRRAFNRDQPTPGPPRTCSPFRIAGGRLLCSRPPSLGRSLAPPSGVQGLGPHYQHISQTSTPIRPQYCSIPYQRSRADPCDDSLLDTFIIWHRSSSSSLRSHAHHQQWGSPNLKVRT